MQKELRNRKFKEKRFTVGHLREKQIHHNKSLIRFIVKKKHIF